MTLNTQNSFLISLFMHLLFIAVFIAMPKPEYRINQLIDISFLFQAVENEAQEHQALIKKPVSKSEKVTAYAKTPARIEDRQIEKSSAFESHDHPSKIEPLLSHKSEAAARTSEGYLPVISNDDNVTGADTGHVRSGVNKGLVSDTLSSVTSKTSVSRGERAGSSGSAVDKSAIIGAFVDKIESLKHYPYIARRRGMEGTVIVFVHIGKTGELKEVMLRESSSYAILDRSAIDLIKKACPFRHGYKSDLKIEIPITYRLLR